MLKNSFNKLRIRISRYKINKEMSKISIHQKRPPLGVCPRLRGWILQTISSAVTRAPITNYFQQIQRLVNMSKIF